MNLDNEIEQTALGYLLEAAKTFYENPINKQAFEAWKEKRHEDHSSIRLPGRV